ncbi:adiponectin receptor protein 2 isoform X1 [Phyllopteryx taeniolatus]|uniref:adiponectin receptor protein 2 isoform X1 n=1 Tax=Phyllopteryx taeniolatus TaxID=161469 RepID=UPI002AD30BD5|nr:adiponectin receptor protein 2 isoform X1 [Phyllopteryx taeniolatus]
MGMTPLLQAHHAMEKMEEFVHKVWEGRWRVIPHDVLPDWLKDNDFLLHGHRPPMPSFRACFRSIFRIHTETGNIWTHLLGCLFFLCLGLMYMFRPNMSFVAPVQEKVAIGMFFLGAILCLSFSWLFHTVYCHSEGVSRVFSNVLLACENEAPQSAMNFSAGEKSQINKPNAHTHSQSLQQAGLQRHRLPDHGLVRAVALLLLLLLSSAVHHLPAGGVRAGPVRHHRVPVRLLRNAAVPRGPRRCVCGLGSERRGAHPSLCHQRGSHPSHHHRADGLAAAHGHALHHRSLPIRRSHPGEVLPRQVRHLVPLSPVVPHLGGGGRFRSLPRCLQPAGVSLHSRSGLHRRRNALTHANAHVFTSTLLQGAVVFL